MRINRSHCLVLFAIISAGISSAQSCVPPKGFIDTPAPFVTAPSVAVAEQLVSHTEEINIDRPLAIVLASLHRPIKDTIKKAASLPGVSGEYLLAGTVFGVPGSRRLTCLTDGSTLEEQVLQPDQAGSSDHFRYVVWHYTTPQARPIEYGVGDFLYTDAGHGHTHVVWTYSFKLNEQRFPGYLGAFGRYLFQVGFLDRGYADMMRGTLDGIKKNAER